MIGSIVLLAKMGTRGSDKEASREEEEDERSLPLIRKFAHQPPKIHCQNPFVESRVEGG